MFHFIEGLDGQQTMLLPEHLDDYVDEHIRTEKLFEFEAQAWTISR